MLVRVWIGGREKERERESGSRRRGEERKKKERRGCRGGREAESHRQMARGAR